MRVLRILLTYKKKMLKDYKDYNKKEIRTYATTF